RERLESLIRRHGLENEISVSRLLRFMKMNGVSFSQIEHDFETKLSRMNRERRAKALSSLKLSKRKWSWWFPVITGLFLLVIFGIAKLNTGKHNQSTADLNTN